MNAWLTFGIWYASGWGFLLLGTWLADADDGPDSGWTPLLLLAAIVIPLFGPLVGGAVLSYLLTTNDQRPRAFRKWWTTPIRK